MTQKVIKRNGVKVPFDKNKIQSAVERAFVEVHLNDWKSNFVKTFANAITKDVVQSIEEHDEISVEDIQDVVEHWLMRSDDLETAKAYIKYRYEHELARQRHTDKELLEMVGGDSEYWNTENSNKNVKWVTTQRDYMAGIVSTDIARNFIFPKNIIEAHDSGLIHIHDMDYMAQNTLHNCCLINLDDMLQNGTVVNGVTIDKPHRISTAMTIATQIIAAVASSQYGGCTISLTHLAPFVKMSFNRYYNKYREWCFSDKDAIKFATLDTKKEVADAVQTLNYQLNSLTTTNGQSPFISIMMYLNETQEYKDELALLIEEVLKQRILGMKNRVGVYVTIAFPKLLYVLEDDNITSDSKYWYLTELAAKCTAKRMVPDYISEKIMKGLKVDKNGDGQCYPSMGCRSFLTPYVDENGKAKYYGRFNQGVVTINLVDVACSSKGDMKEFWRIMDERLDLCYRALMCRHERLLGTPSDVAPILWQYGALARLKKGEVIDKLLFNGYSTISLGYAGLCECVHYMTGKSHTDPSATPFALEVMQHLNDRCNEWKEKENIDFSIYGTPIESTTYKFAKCLQKRFGKIKDVTDKSYITNSYHVHVTENIDAFAKLTFEAQFQKLSPGGAISYVEVPNMQDNIDAVLAVMKHIYNHIMYAELNTKSDYCMECGYDGEIQIKEDENGKLIWKCPNCGNTDQDKMSVARRTCGYIGTQFWNQGRTQEIKERVLHL